jgi:hypothetical protein
MRLTRVKKIWTRLAICSPLPLSYRTRVNYVMMSSTRSRRSRAMMAEAPHILALSVGVCLGVRD